MNYYEHHIGDYDKNTSHLTACEDGIYSRMIRRYYDKETPLPASVEEVKRLMRARTKEEKQAVVDVLAEFFSLQDDGWHNKVCDEVLEKFIAGEPEREVKKANEDNRLKRHRAERAELFKTITDAGEHAPWNIGMEQLRELANRIKSPTPATAIETAPATQPATAPATLATATQTPLPIHHTPVDKKNTPLPPKGGGCRRFEEFWTSWPKGERKQDKVKCAEKWRRGDLDSIAEQIFADIEIKRGTEKWQGGFIEAPLVYLNGRRWEDGVEADGHTGRVNFV